MAAGSLRNVGEPKFRTPEVVKIGNNPPPTTPPGMMLPPPPPNTTWLDMENREYSEFQISVDANFHITTVHANEGARFRLFIYRSTDTEIAVDINPWLDEVIKVPGTSVSKIYVLNVECYLVPGEDKLRYKVSNLIFDDQARKDKTWSSSKIKETINSVINDEAVSLTGTWSSTKLKQAIDSKQDKIGNSLEVDEIVRKSDAETGGLTFLSKSIHKSWGDREDQRPTFRFISRVYDAFGNVVSETIPFYLSGGGTLQATSLNAAILTLNNLNVATESFVNAAIQAVTDLMSTDAERIAAINELTQNYNAADDLLEQTLTTALAKKAGKAVNEEITGIYNFLNGLKENGVPLKALYLGIGDTAQNALKLGGILAATYLRRDAAEFITGSYTFSNGGLQAKFINPVKPNERVEMEWGRFGVWNANDEREVRFAGYGNNFVNAISGNFGIGTTSPQEKLDVNGNVKIKGTQKIDPPAQTGVNVLDLRTSGSTAELDYSILMGREYDNRFFSIKARSNAYFSGGTTQIDIAYNRTESFKHIMTLQQSGNVGIGTTTPEEKLDVNGRGIFRTKDNFGIRSVAEGTTIGHAPGSLRLDNLAHVFRGIGTFMSYLGSDANRTQGTWYSGTAYGDYANRYILGWQADTLFKESAAHIDNALYEFDTLGNLDIVGSLAQTSDRRKKSNIKPLTPRGELNPVTFIKDGKPDLGFVAQEVKELYPELVAGEETENTFLKLNYSQITAVLAAELKELRAEVKQLKQLIQNDTKI